MTKIQLEKYRQQLEHMRGRLKGDVSHLTGEALRHAGGEASGSLSNTPIHMADLGSDNFEQEFTFSLLENEEQTLEEIAAALVRIDQGRYGTCEGENCGKVIPKARLDALPFTRHCVECARKLQQSA
jgi:DnaK suppressor protein